MGQVEGRLAAVGLSVPQVVPPLAAYVPAVREGSWIFTSGQLPMRDGSLMRTGLVGAEVRIEHATECAAQAALNALGAIKSVIGNLDEVLRVVKVVGYVATAPGFIEIPHVVNGASALLQTAFGDAGTHARSAIGCASLPLGSPVEIELTVSVAG
ncbi:MAG: RidA family protein [Candidatus Nanopelagicales bacterium]|nr:RidA family protein [Candidatus Nanopelagicales bacterium]MDZ4248671.1 RidA family protein [Candidatus Nanopelagicales bacterium]